MSKITPKNLHYDDSLPPFLARLRAAQSTSDSRSEYHAARPKKPRNPDEEAEDEPVYFAEESGETLSKAEWEAKDAEKEETDVVGEGEGVEGKVGEEGGKEKVKEAAIGVSKKRKAGKVVGGEEEEEEVKGESAKKSVPKGEGKKVEKGKSTKKGKKIKLSFGDDEP